MKYNVFKNIISDQIGNPNSKSTDSIADAISEAYIYACMNSAKTTFGSIFLPPLANVKNDLKKSISNCLTGVKKCEDIKNTKPSWTLMAVGILNFWTKITFTPGVPPPPCIGPAPGPPSSSGTKVLGGNVNKLSNKLYEIAGKFRENFNEWVNLLFDTLVDFHLTLFGNYLGLAIAGLATVPFSVPWVGILSSANDSSKNPPVEKVKPSGGRGSQLSNMVEFERKYEHAEYEYAMVTSFNGYIVWEGTNYDSGAVSSPESVDRIANWNVADLILTHNHPVQTYLDEAVVGFGGAFSPEDIIFAINYNYYELRAIDQLYKYILQRPKKGWDDYVKVSGIKTFGFGSTAEVSNVYTIKNDVQTDILNTYDRAYDARLNAIAEDDRRLSKLLKEVKTMLDENDTKQITTIARTYDLKRMVIHLDATHAAATAVCSKYGIPYERVLRKKS